MLYRDFGKTGKRVSVVGFGGNRFDVKNNSFEANVELVLSAAKAGINYFDTAHLYCEGLSEKIIGEGLGLAASYLETPLYVSSKSALNADPSADAVLRRVEKSLAALNRPKIDFFHIWGVLDLKQWSQIMRADGPIFGAISAKERGLVEHICVSVHLSGDEIDILLKEDIFDVITIGFNALNWRYRVKGIKKAAEKGLGVAVMNPLGGGVIPRSGKYFSYLDAGGNAGIAAGAFKFVAAHKEVSTVLAGIESIRDIEQAVAAIGTEASLESYDLQNIYSFFGTSDNTICSGCKYCADCPGGIEPQKLMSAYNEYIFTEGDRQYFFDRLKEWYGLSPYLKHDCIACGYCEKRCTQHLPIIKRIEEINGWSEEKYSEIFAVCERVFPKDKNEKVGIYAASVAAVQLIDCYKASHGEIDFPLFIFDSNTELHGRLFTDSALPIRPPADINSLGIRRIVVANRKYFSEIEKALRKFIPEGVIIESI